MRFLKGKLLFALVAVLSLCLLVSACGSFTGENGGQAQDSNNKQIRIALNNWAENIAVSNMWKVILEEKGYTVELTEADKAIVYTGVAQGDQDLGLEVWLPSTDEPFWNKYKDNLEQLGPWYEGTGLGLAVPEYVDINSIEELNDHKDKFIVDGKPSIIGIDAGASLMRMTEEAIVEYGLDYKLIDGSEPAMMASLKRAYDKNEPVLVTLWNPHWAFADYELKYLNDPKNVYGDEENIYIMATKGFSEQNPEVARWLNNWQMDDQTLGSLMGTINDAENAYEGAKTWIENNRDIVDGWLQ